MVRDDKKTTMPKQMNLIKKKSQIQINDCFILFSEEKNDRSPLFVLLLIRYKVVEKSLNSKSSY